MDVESTRILLRKNFILLTQTSFSGHFVNLIGKGGFSKEGGSLLLPATSFISLENMIIWCKIQVIINPFTEVISLSLSFTI